MYCAVKPIPSFTGFVDVRDVVHHLALLQYGSDLIICSLLDYLTKQLELATPPTYTLVRDVCLLKTLGFRSGTTVAFMVLSSPLSIPVFFPDCLFPIRLSASVLL